MTGCEKARALRTWQRVQLGQGRWHGRRRAASESALDPGLWIYRQRTAALLQRYFRLSVEVGRLPSVLGREFFRAHFRLGRKVTFEDAVIFVHDMERCLEKLDEFSQQVLVWVVLQGYSQEETSRLLGCARRTVSRHVPEALDRLTEILQQDGML